MYLHLVIIKIPEATAKQLLPSKEWEKFGPGLMGEGFILLTRGYGFMGGLYHPPFDTLKIGTSTDDIKLKLYR